MIVFQGGQRANLGHELLPMLPVEPNPIREYPDRGFGAQLHMLGQPKLTDGVLPDLRK